MGKWIFANENKDVKRIAEKFGIHETAAQIIFNRGVLEDEEIDEYLNGTLDDLYDAFLLSNMELGVQYLIEHIKKDSKIRVIGDYDVDGICAAYILKGGIAKCGGNVSIAIPHRMTDGYGLNKNLINQAYEEKVDLIITCDNGISAIEEIAYANELGMEVIVTDHHELLFEETEQGRREIVPECLAIINPKQKGDSYPNKNLCGAMVAYKMMEVLFIKMEESCDYLVDNYLEFGACATICDVMVLQGENRIIVKYGLEQIRKTNNLGLKTLIKVNDIKQNEVACHHIGFRIGPCFNATGRLETAMLTISLLESTEEAEAERIANELKELNEKRKTMTVQGVERAVKELDQSGHEGDKIFVIYLKECHESIAGIIAGRIKEKYYRPTFILTQTEAGVKGSGRSIEGYHMQEAMVTVKTLFTRFGGHAMAAGLSMKEELVDDLRKTLNDNCELTEEQLEEKMMIDVDVPFDCITETLIKDINVLEPFGVGNRKPVFARKSVKFLKENVLGKKNNLLKAIIEDSTGTKLTIVCLGVAQIKEFHDYIQVRYGVSSSQGLTLDIVFDLGINEYNGVRTIQLILKQYV